MKRMENKLEEEVSNTQAGSRKRDKRSHIQLKDDYSEIPGNEY